MSIKFLENSHGFGELCLYTDSINTFAEYVGISEILKIGASAISNLAKVLGMILQHNATFDNNGKHAWAH